MLAIMDFAIASARRQAEITRLEWADNDEIGRTGLVRDAKHPRHKEGNHRRFKFTPEAWAIVERQPRTAEYIFPFDAQSVGAAFTRACGILGIKDLHFHDPRHEATSRLFERGYQIDEVAQFTLHDSWNELKRYANLKPEDVRDITVPTRCQAVGTINRHTSVPGASQAFARRRSISSARSVALTSQGDFCPPRRKTAHGSILAGARRRASSNDRPKYLGATRSSGILASPNSANRPK